MKNWFNRNLLYFALIVALSSMLGSLFFSEILGYAPCILCWYQRIAMYPLVIIFIVGILRKEAKLYQYVMPFVWIGGLIAFYHSLLTHGVIEESLATCKFGVSCITEYFNVLGFIDIPLLSLLSFVFIGLLINIHKKEVEKNEQGN